MDTLNNKNYTMNNVKLESLNKNTRKEEKMSTKSLFRIVVSAIVLTSILLGVKAISNASSKVGTPDGSMSEVKLAGSDYIERHPAAVRPPNYYLGSDWIEHHPAAVRPANYYLGSDWIERHPEIARPLNYYIGSDWIERHPNDPYAGSDWIERHPTQPNR